MPKISIKSPEEISIMAEGGKILGTILTEVLDKIETGLSTFEIDCWIDNKIVQAGGEPSFKLVPRYHWASCIGLNDEVVHGIPSKDKILKEEDLLKIDLGMLWKGFHTDLSWTILVESKEIKPSIQNDEKVRFIASGEKALVEAIKVAKEGNRIGHISQKIQEIIESQGYHPVEILTGHGIGRKLHEEPLIPGVLCQALELTPKLVPGMALAIEVIYNQGNPEVVLENDGWTVSTKDGKMAGLFEKTIAITGSEPLVLTPIKGL